MGSVGGDAAGAGLVAAVELSVSGPDASCLQGVDVEWTYPAAPVPGSARAAEIALRFGLAACAPTVVLPPTRIPLPAGGIVLFAGASGSGKSTALEAIDRQLAAAVRVDRIGFPQDSAIIDAVAPGAALAEVVGLLTACGLGEPRLWLRRFAELSAGEQFRARLAAGLAIQAGGVAGSDPAAPLLCDEFCTVLHRRAAKAIAFNLHKLVTRRRLRVVLACAHDELLADLQPCTVVRLRGAAPPLVEVRAARARSAPTFLRGMSIEPGGKHDYHAFAAMHYRDAGELGFVDKVFVLRHRRAEVVGIVVYAHSPLELALRNAVTGGCFSRRPDLVNRHLRILRRLVIHPDLRGCGLGHHLVRCTLPLVGTDYVECLATLGDFNPVFERAGMQRVGRCTMDARRRAALAALQALDVDPRGTDFVTQVCRQRRVRDIVTATVRDWYAATTGGGETRVARQSPLTLARTFRALIASEPVYYLWRRPGVPGFADLVTPGDAAAAPRTAEAPTHQGESRRAEHSSLRTDPRRRAHAAKRRDRCATEFARMHARQDPVLTPLRERRRRPRRRFRSGDVALPMQGDERNDGGRTRPDAPAPS